MTWDGIPEHWGKGHYRDVPISKWVKLARERHVNDLKRAAANDPGFPYYFDMEAADHAVQFMELLVLYEGQFRGKRFKLADWQEWDIVRPIFGWKKKSDGTRRFKDATCFIPRKNGKSVFAAAIGAYLLFGDNEFSAQVFCAATKEAQARIVFKAAKKLIQGSPELRKYITATKTSLFCEALDSVFIPLGRDSDTQDGLNAHGAIIDEYHAHKTTDLKDVIESSMGMRLQPLLFTISTYGYGEMTPCREEDELGKKVLLGERSIETYYVYIATVDNVDDWENEEEWFKANPSLGITMSLERFREDYEKAKRKPKTLREFKVKRLNIWSTAAHKWMDMEKYRKIDRSPIIWLPFKGRSCFSGLDVGLTRDLTAFAMVFDGDPPGTHKENSTEIAPGVYVKMTYWISEEGLEKREEDDKFSYGQFIDEGWIRTTEGSQVKLDVVANDILQFNDEYQITEVAADRAHAYAILQKLADNGMKVFEHNQGISATTAGIREAEDLIYDRHLRDGGDPVLLWQFGNAVARTNADELIKLLKDKSRDRIDGLTALCMALGRRKIVKPPAPSEYETERLFVVG